MKEAYTDEPTPTSGMPPPLSLGLTRTHLEAEPWQLENNRYIMGHYRAVSHSYRTSFASLGYLHNQTSNIYSHMMAAVMFLYWASQTLDEVLARYPTSDIFDTMVFGLFYACASFCFSSSALFHLLANHSADVNRTWLLFDLYGVFALITATIVSGAYYGFYCEPIWWLVYSGGVRTPLPNVS